MTDSPPQQTYKVLARKYRPTRFEDMIGQESMVTTLTNAFKAGRVAHAFMLTGVRGIGKTTTARLLARALNYENEAGEGPSTNLSTPGIHCEAIMASSHMDVLEMDAASRTGVENMRELLDGVRYAPVSARYKVYIIDEVHMLSTGAFNALLKTLEEPPDHAKFIFATTEIRKVPVTVLSRCQRFDLRRVDADVLQAHLETICAREGVTITSEGLALIARAAEGSVRDGLSLLDQALVQSTQADTAVTTDQIQAMLGLADRGRITDMFAMAIGGDCAGALREMKAQYDDGADPAIVIRDMLDISHEISRAKALGDQTEFDAAPDQATRLIALAEALSLGQLSRIWQLLLKAYEDVRLAPMPLAAAEMALLKLSVSSQLPPPELAAQLLEAIQSGDVTAPVVSPPPAAALSSDAQALASSSPVLASAPPSVGTRRGAQSQAQIQAQAQPQAQADHQTLAKQLINSFEDYVQALPDHYIDLRYDVEKYVRLIRFRPGAISIETLTDAPPSLIGRMVESLRDLTGTLWLIEQEAGPGAPSLMEQRREAKAVQDAKDRAHPAFTHPLFEKAKLLDIYDVAPTSAQSDDAQDTNVITGRFDRPDDDRSDQH